MATYKNFIRKKLLFCNIAWMRDYKGAKGDKPQGGGAYVDETGVAWESENFCAWNGICYGYVQPPSKNGRYMDAQIHIERLGASRSAAEISGITVIWTAPHPEYGGRWVVGYYKNATVRRSYSEDLLRIRASKRDCCVVPEDKRNVDAGVIRCQSNIRYGDGLSAAKYKKFLAKIDNLLRKA